MDVRSFNIKTAEQNKKFEKNSRWKYNCASSLFCGKTNTRKRKIYTEEEKVKNMCVLARFYNFGTFYDRLTKI